MSAKKILERCRYKTWQDASEAAVVLEIRTRVDYLAAYIEDPLLPASPETAYAADWSRLGGWYGFLRKDPPELYGSWRAAANACRALGIKSSHQYRDAHKRDPRLPSRPELKYSETWDLIGRWQGFLNPVSQSTTVIKKAGHLVLAA